MIRRLISLALLLATAMPIGRAVAAPGDDPHNAATWYRRAFERLSAMSIEDRNAIADFAADPSAAPSQRVRQILAQSQPALDLFRRAAQESRSDFELEYSQGPYLLMPHVNAMRQLARMAMADAMVKLHDGDSAAASDRLGGIYRMSDQLRSDGVAISSLVGAAIFSLSEKGTQFGLDHGAFTAEDGARLLAATKSIDAADPFGFVNSLVGEKEHFIGWAREEFSGDGGLEKFKEGILAWDESAARSAKLMEVSMTTQAQLDASLESADAVMQRAIDAFRMPDPIDARFELEQISREIERGDLGIAAMLMPASNRLYDAMINSREALAERQATLRELAEGTASPAMLINAAIGYLEAIKALDAMDPVKLALFDKIADEGRLPQDPDALIAALEALEKSGPIIDTLRDASLKKRCDFSIANLERPSAILNYAAGMRELTRLLHADAVYHSREDQADPVIDRLAIVLRMSAHLAGDKAIISSLTAHTMFNATTRLLETGIAQGSASDEQRAILLTAAKLSAKSDAFGYAKAIEADRKAVTRWVSYQPAAPKAPAFSVAEIVKKLDGERLLYLAAIADAVRQPEADLKVTLARFGDVISGEDLVAARSAAAEMQELYSAGKFDVIAARQIAEIGRVEQRRAEAVDDLRKALAMLHKARDAETRNEQVSR